MTRSLLLAALAVALAVPAAAQPAERHRIVVTTVGATCQYRIATQAAQDRFEVAPGDRLRLQGLAGTKATFDFVPDRGGVAPLRGAQSVAVEPGTPANGQTVTVRAARGQDTDHEVIIRCCTDRQGNTCNAWARATPAASDLGAHPAPLPGAPTSGPAADDPPADVPVVDGPRMVVKE